MSDKLAALFKSRRFWAALAGMAVLFADPFGLDPETVEQTIMLISVWIVGDSLTKTV